MHAVFEAVAFQERRSPAAASLLGGMATREEQRREHNEAKELEALRRVFDELDKTRVGKIGFEELNKQLVKLDYRAKRVEVEDMIWEVDEDCDHHVSWDEFKLMFHRCRNDRVRAATGLRREGEGAGAGRNRSK